jgi:hypothetical protein
MIAKEMEKMLAFDCKYVDGVKKENTFHCCCIKHLSPDYIFKLRASMTEGENGQLLKILVQITTSEIYLLVGKSEL